MTTHNPLPLTDTNVAHPEPSTLVLMSRPLRPGTNTDRLSRFGQDRWDIDPAIFEDHFCAHSINFATIPPPLRHEVKIYFWQLLNHTGAARLRGGNSRPSVRTVMAALGLLRPLLAWMNERSLTSFGQVTNPMLDDYLLALAEEPIRLQMKYQRLMEVKRLWSYRTALPEDMRLPSSPPWGGEESFEIFGRTVNYIENRTPRIAELTMQHLLWWAIRFVDDFAADILAAYSEHLTLHAQEPQERARTGRSARPPHGDVPRRLDDYAARLRNHGGCLPGTLDDNGDTVVDWHHIGLIIGAVGDTLGRTAAGRRVLELGLEVSDQADLDTPITALLDGQPWRDRPISYHEAPKMARLLSTACFVVIAYLSGARPGEVLNLQRGCLEYDAANDLWLMQGLYFKNAVDTDGNKLPAGQQRRVPWVVIDIVARAIGVLEQLHPQPLLFPTWLQPDRRTHNLKRQGKARTSTTIARDITRFVTWVNDECRRGGRTDAIPEDPSGGLNASRFRRTLAWFIRRRPRGLIAASIQYGHAHTRMLQGYAGTYESGFPDDYAFEDWLYRLENIADDHRALDDGEHVSGPAADAYRQRVTAADGQFAGHVLTNIRQTRDLLGNPLLQIHHGDGMTCVFDPAHAACQIRGTAGDPLVTPDLDDCRPKCRNIARTDRDIAVIRARHDALTTMVSDPLAPPIRHERERYELHRLATILDIHERPPRERSAGV
ncbi:MAG: hypothetical protein H5T78_25845 [Nocardia sp.]|nr:hypothetical protein [Nocardia sp.]